MSDGLGALTAGRQQTIHVIATTVDGTRAALEAAVPLAKGAAAKLMVTVPRIVPYPVDLDAPCEPTTFFVRRYKDLIEHLGGSATINVCLCRRVDDIAMAVGSDGSIVVVGGPVGRWLTSPEERFANRLSQQGARVIFAASGCNTTQRRVAPAMAAAVGMLLAIAPQAFAQTPPGPAALSYGGFIDVGALIASNSPSNHRFRNRGTTPLVDELDVDMAAAYLKKTPTESSRAGVEVTAQAGEDAKSFGFSATAPNLGGADVLLHLGPTNVSYLAPVGKGLTIQGGIFSSLIGYDSLYAKDNFTYTRPWGADYTPYLMLGANVSYPFSDKLTITAGLVNGYWHLANANDVPSVVGQAAYKLSDRVTIKETALVGPHQADTDMDFVRTLSDTIVERKTDRLTTAVEYQLSGERVAVPGSPRALWMSAQLPVHWIVSGPLSATVRPEFCWDRDGRWTGFPQRVVAVTAGGEYRIPIRGAQAIVRAEYRVDDSRGDGGGFFAGADNHLTPTQNLFVAALIVTYDGAVKR
jgi:Putative beta-barrel porin-2, OmpL-like. bbp2